MKRLLKFGGLTLALLASPMAVNYLLAQPPPPESIPIDGGASILIGAGVAYGVKKIYDRRKKQNRA